MKTKNPKIKETRLYSFVKNNFNEDNSIIHFKTGIDYNKLSKILNNDVNLSAEEFLLIAKLLAPNKITEMADYVFEDYTTLFQSQETKDESLSLFGTFISKHLKSKKDLADAANITVPLFTNLMKSDTGINSKLVAAELFIICKHIGRDFKEALEEIYPKCTLMSKKQQEILEKEFNARNKKAK